MTTSPSAPTTDHDSTSSAAEPVRLSPEKTTLISPLIAAGSRFPVGTGNPDDDAVLGPVERRTFLLRGAEPSQHSPDRMGATPKTTSGYDGTRDDDSEEFNHPDFSP